MEYKTGVIFGRFQPLHIGHMDHLRTPLEECDHLYIGITNPDPHYMAPVEEDVNRGKSESNPYTYYQRMNMIIASLDEIGISRSQYSIVPFPINKPESIISYTPQNAIYYVTLLSNDDNEWNYKKVGLLKDLGLTVKTIEYKRRTSATIIRDKIRLNQNFRNLVPSPVSEILDKISKED